MMGLMTTGSQVYYSMITRWVEGLTATGRPVGRLAATVAPTLPLCSAVRQGSSRERSRLREVVVLVLLALVALVAAREMRHQVVSH